MFCKAMKYLHPYLYEIVHNLVKGRIDDKIFPYVASLNLVKQQVITDVITSLKEMESEGLITTSENVNGIALYRPLKEKEDENDNV